MGETPKKPRKKKIHTHNTSIEDSSTDIESSIALNWSMDFKIKKPFHFSKKHLSFYEKIKADGTNMTFVNGSAGTAKSYIAVLAALELFKEKKIKNIIYIRSVFESASRSMGALPGEVDDKFLPYAMPLLEKANEITDESTTAQLKSNGILNAIPVNFVRGLTFNDAVVIVDEAQNLTRSELVTILTRFGKNTRYVVCGDLKQSDIGKSSGYYDIFNRFSTEDCENHGIYSFTFGETEIVRSKILRYIVSVLEA
jgi:phosphate starvation-inducible PhoH-like protein